MKKKTVKAYVVVAGRRKELVYKGGILDTLAIFPNRRHANAFAIACYRIELNELKNYVVPCTITYTI